MFFCRLVSLLRTEVPDVEDLAMVVGHTGWVVPLNDSEALCLVWREIFLLEGSFHVAIKH